MKMRLSFHCLGSLLAAAALLLPGCGTMDTDSDAMAEYPDAVRTLTAHAWAFADTYAAGVAPGSYLITREFRADGTGTTTIDLIGYCKPGKLFRFDRPLGHGLYHGTSTESFHWKPEKNGRFRCSRGIDMTETGNAPGGMETGGEIEFDLAAFASKWTPVDSSAAPVHFTPEQVAQLNQQWSADGPAISNGAANAEMMQTFGAIAGAASALAPALAQNAALAHAPTIVARPPVVATTTATNVPAAVSRPPVSTAAATRPNTPRQAEYISRADLDGGSSRAAAVNPAPVVNRSAPQTAPRQNYAPAATTTSRSAVTTTTSGQSVQLAGATAGAGAAIVSAAGSHAPAPAATPERKKRSPGRQVVLHTTFSKDGVDIEVTATKIYLEMGAEAARGEPYNSFKIVFDARMINNNNEAAQFNFRAVGEFTGGRTLLLNDGFGGLSGHRTIEKQIGVFEDEDLVRLNDFVMTVDLKPQNPHGYSGYTTH